MADEKKKQDLEALVDFLGLPKDLVAQISAKPLAKQQELVIQLGLQAIEKNAKLGGKLQTSRQVISRLKDEIEKTTTPPYSIATVINTSDTGEHVDIHRSGQEMRVPVSANVNASELARGCRVLLSESLVVIKVIDFGGHGEIMTIKEVLPSEGRAVVVGRNDDEKVVYLGGALDPYSLQTGHSLLVNRTDIATEVISKSEVNNLILEEVPDISYADIGGLTDQIKKIRDAVELPYLRPDMYEKFQLKSPKGILLYGPPGCGKTMIAKAIANALAKKVAEKTEQDVRAFFLNVKGPELLDKYVGETERQIRLIFQRAREKASAGHPVIIFFDEMESMFSTRGSGISSDTEKTIVPQLLTELDGVESLSNVIVIGASNREDLIDPAVTRPGRLDIKIKVERPDETAAIDIFSKYLNIDLPLHKTSLDQVKNDRDACISWLVRKTVDYMYETAERTEFLTVTYEKGDKETLYFKDFSSGAMIQNIVDRAKKSAILDELDTGVEGISLQHLLDACDDEFQDNEDLPNTTNPHDWTKITGKKGQRIIHIARTLRSDKNHASHKLMETVETPNTGLYL